MRAVRVLDIPVSTLSLADLIDQLWAWLDSTAPEPHRIYVVRGAVLQASRHNARLKSLLQEAHLCLPGGSEVVLAGGMEFPDLGSTVTAGLDALAERFGRSRTTTDSEAALLSLLTVDTWLPSILQHLAAQRRGIYYIGGYARATHAFADKLRAGYPGLHVEAQDGAFEKWGPENDRVMRAVLKANPAMVLVGLGSPYQEEYVHAHASLLKAPLCVSVGPLAEESTGFWPEGPLEGVVRASDPATGDESLLTSSISQLSKQLGRARRGIAALENAGVVLSSLRHRNRKDSEPKQ